MWRLGEGSLLLFIHLLEIEILLGLLGLAISISTGGSSKGQAVVEARILYSTSGSGQCKPQWTERKGTIPVRESMILLQSERMITPSFFGPTTSCCGMIVLNCLWNCNKCWDEVKCHLTVIFLSSSSETGRWQQSG